jgi:hypothetical protein
MTSFVYPAEHNSLGLAIYIQGEHKGTVHFKMTQKTNVACL